MVQTDANDSDATTGGGAGSLADSAAPGWRRGIRHVSLRHRLSLLIALVALALLGVTIGWRQQEQSRTAMMLKSESDQTHTLLADINELRGRVYENFANDYSRWDEAAEFVSHPDPEWAVENLDAAAESFDIQGVFVFDATGKQVYALPESIPDRVAELPVHPTRFRALFAKETRVRFFAKDERGLLEVFGATIHKSADVERTGQRFGTLFAVKRWNEPYLQELRELTNCDIRIYTPVEWVQLENSGRRSSGSVRVDERAMGPFGEQVAVLELSRSSAVLVEIERATKDALELFALFAVFAFCTLVFGFYRFIGVPLDRVTAALRRQNAAPLAPLLAAHHEFGKLARLIRDFFDQKCDLTQEVERRKSSEGELAKACQQAEQAGQTKLRFLANVSHEIRTPLNGVIGLIDLLKETKLEPAQAELVDALKGSGDGMLEVLNDVLDLAKLEEGKVVLDCIEFDLGAMVEEVAMLFAPQAQAKGLEIGSVLPSDARLHLRGDRSRVRQILMNLTGNAVKFTKCGEVRISVRALEFGQARCRYALSVRDTGIGIPKDKLTTIFEAFGQASTRDSRVYGGTGLGLTISRHLAGVLGGGIQVESREGQGSEFTVEIPFETARSDWAARIECVRSRRVIVVAEQALTRSTLESKLAATCSEVVFCDSLEQAQTRLVERDGHPIAPLIFLEHRRSQGSALEVARKLAKFARRHAVHAAFIVNLVESTLLRALPPGDLPRILAKPIRMRALREIVEDERVLRSEAEAAAVETRSAPPADVEGKRVLVAHSHPPTQRILLDLVTSVGSKATLATDGVAALTELTTSRFDFAIIDLRLSRIDGSELARRLRAHEAASGKPRLPIIAMNAPEWEREHWHAAGIDQSIEPERGAAEFAAVLRRALLASEPAFD